jgi:hypothetical protein
VLAIARSVARLPPAEPPPPAFPDALSSGNAYTRYCRADSRYEVIPLLRDPLYARSVADDAFLAELRETANRQFAEQWRRWRGDRLLPRRGDIELGSIRRLLGSVMLFEVQAPETVLVKVAGTALREHYGYELTGKNYVELAPPERQATRRFRMWQSVTRPCGSRLIREHKVAPCGSRDISGSVQRRRRTAHAADACRAIHRAVRQRSRGHGGRVRRGRRLRLPRYRCRRTRPHGAVTPVATYLYRA